ncbi:MAG: ChbG/HpnK family deacetylase [Candidatus Omnitrophica bacterium]|nr:ChbG/HpnK family deacetylase [Candidatus Omnitrophota bacterium]
MKSLIINLDDVGLSGAISEAAKECLQAGAITGVSIIACGKAFKEACTTLRGLGRLEVGVHLTLTGTFEPVTLEHEKVDSVLKNENVFFDSYFTFFSRYFRGKINSEEIYTEFENQVEKIQREGLSVTHIDSHEHIHVVPGLLLLVLRLANEYGIPYVRLPLEGSKVIFKKFRTKDLIRHLALKMFALPAKSAIKRTGINSNNSFLGHFHAGRIDNDILRFLIKNMPRGVSELAVHAGVESEELLEESPWHENAHKELEALLRGSWKTLLKDERVRMVSHSEAFI